MRGKVTLILKPRKQATLGTCIYSVLCITHGDTIPNFVITWVKIVTFGLEVRSLRVPVGPHIHRGRHRVQESRERADLLLGVCGLEMGRGGGQTESTALVLLHPRWVMLTCKCPCGALVLLLAYIYPARPPPPDYPLASPSPYPALLCPS